MKNNRFKRALELALCIALLTSVFFTINISGSTPQIDNVSFEEATVNVDSLNMRQGPSTSMPVVASLKKDQKIRVLGKTGEWYFVFDYASGKVGAVHGSYITPVTQNSKDPKQTTNPEPSQKKPDEETFGATDDEKIILELVNNARKNAGAGELEFDPVLCRIARDKAKDMVENNYFSHQSPTYGSPFEMMRSYGISFKAAGENIAGNQTMQGAFNAWMSSSGHRKNILNENYNATGIGVYTSPVYGKIVVQLFIRK